MSEVERLIRDIERETRATAGWTGRAVLGKGVVRALRRVNRAAFVTEARKQDAWLPGLADSPSRPHSQSMRTRYEARSPWPSTRMGSRNGAGVVRLAHRRHPAQFVSAVDTLDAAGAFAFERE
jgi:hypothetical protein